YRLSVEQILKSPVLRDLSQLMEASTKLVDQRAVKGSVLLTPVQKWFFESAGEENLHHFNQSVLLKSQLPIGTEVLEKCITDLINHHDALRMVFDQGDGSWKQHNQGTDIKGYTFDFYDLRQHAEPVLKMEQIGGELQAAFNLVEGPLVKVAVFRLPDGDRLGIIIHHLVIDGVSWRILLEDLSKLYAGYSAGDEPKLPLKTNSYRQWALKLNEYLANKDIREEIAYWSEITSQRVPRLPQDHKGGVGKPDSGISISLDKKITELLQTSVHSAYGTEIDDILLTCVGRAVNESLSVSKSVLKMEGHGREEVVDEIDISRTVGWFTSIYPFVLDVSDSSDKIKQLISVKESRRKVPNKGIGYGIIKYLGDEKLNELKQEIVFNYLGDFGANVGHEDQSLFEFSNESIGPNAKGDINADTLLDISGLTIDGELNMTIRYSGQRYAETTIANLANSLKNNLHSLINELSAINRIHKTPSDLSYPELSIDEVALLNTDNQLEDVYELSPLQEGIYFYWLTKQSGSLYLGQSSYRVYVNNVSIENLKSAFDALVARYDVLRTHFSNDYAGKLLQIVKHDA
ncbi:MAG: condensation domain-containing protein, partial [Cyclobacteriaceae bacterium]